MRIDYQKPWFIKPKLTEPQTNPLIDSKFTISLSFSVDKNYKKDNKISNNIK